MTTRKRGRPAFRVTPALAKRVEELVSCGMSHNDIARAVGCSDETLRKHFADNLANGGSRRRAEAIALLFKSARSGNVSSQKKVEELTARASAEASFVEASPAPQKVGKKEAADIAAGTAGQGTEWGEDLEAPVTRPN